MEELCFICGPCRDVTSNGQGQYSSAKVREFDPPGWGSLESETVKCGHESRGTRI
jgi:hypothetical protein